MYWQKRFDRQDLDTEMENLVLEIRTQGICVNKKRIQRIVQKLGLQVTSYTRKSRKYSSLL